MEQRETRPSVDGALGRESCSMTAGASALGEGYVSREAMGVSPIGG